MSEVITPEVKAECINFLSIRKSGVDWESHLSRKLKVLDGLQMRYLENLCEDAGYSIAATVSKLL